MSAPVPEWAVEAAQKIILHGGLEPFAEPHWEGEIAHFIAEAHAKADGWLPIADAPKNGTRVLVAWSHLPHYPYIAYFAHTEWRLDSGGTFGTSPTHFKPLPAPPASGKEEA